MTLRKQHPCGSRAWIVRRVGADVGLECALCAHRVMMKRASFDKAYAGHESREGATPDGSGEAAGPAAGSDARKEGSVG